MTIWETIEKLDKDKGNIERLQEKGRLWLKKELARVHKENIKLGVA